jgi:hypothetical protein
MGANLLEASRMGTEGMESKSLLGDGVEERGFVTGFADGRAVTK